MHHLLASRPQNSFEGIQYLRGVAAIMVVVHHARHYFGDVPDWVIFGASGVDIFFIISGFIMMHATRNLSTGCGNNQKISDAIDFFMRRVIRIVPLYWLALLYENKRSIVYGTADGTLIFDFLFIPQNNLKYPDEIYPSLIPGWTINYEMLFYCIFAVALLFGRARYIILTGALAMLVALGHLIAFETIPLIFWTRNIVGEFALGMAVNYFIQKSNWNPGKFVCVIAMSAGFIFLALPNNGVIRLLSDGVPSALIVWSGVYLGRNIERKGLMSLIGDASYSIYLIHLFTFALSFKALNFMQMQAPTPFNITAALSLSLVIAVIFGIAVHKFVEKPMLEFMQRQWRKAHRPIAPLRA